MQGAEVTCEDFEVRFINLTKRVLDERMSIETLEDEIVPEQKLLQAHAGYCWRCRRLAGGIRLLASEAITVDERQELINIWRMAKECKVSEKDIFDLVREWHQKGKKI